MEHVVGVRFQEAGKIYYFESAGYEDLEVGENVVVETSRGLELARVVIAPGQVLNVELTEPLKPITRLAYDDDLEQTARLKRRAAADVEVARRKVADARLAMKIVSGNYNLDGSRLTFFFTSEGRIDFRDLVRDLSSAVGAQVQLRQVGPRDQAKIVGGYGRCGRRLCCSSWLVNFPAISIKMAKEQDLPLNPSKISGQCGRLLCCLSYENDMYRQVKQALPRPGTYVSTPTGNARILAVNVPRETVTMQTETMQILDISIQDLGMERGLVRILDGPPPPPPGAQQMIRPAVAPGPSRRGAPRTQEPADTAKPRSPAADGAAAPAARTGSDGRRTAPNGRRSQDRVPSTPPAPAPDTETAAPQSAGQSRGRRRRRRGGLGSGTHPPQA